MPNTIAQLSKYFLAIGSFEGIPEGNAFAKRYELHYQPKKVETPEGVMFTRYGCLNFHAKRDGGRSLAWPSKTSGPQGGKNLGSIATSHASAVLRLGKVCMLYNHE
jgi:hypothetical protein